jgi:hypothetical protein
VTETTTANPELLADQVSSQAGYVCGTAAGMPRTDLSAQPDLLQRGVQAGCAPAACPASPGSTAEIGYTPYGSSAASGDVNDSPHLADCTCSGKG